MLCMNFVTFKDNKLNKNHYERKKWKLRLKEIIAYKYLFDHAKLKQKKTNCKYLKNCCKQNRVKKCRKKICDSIL